MCLSLLAASFDSTSADVIGINGKSFCTVFGWATGENLLKATVSISENCYESGETKIAYIIPSFDNSISLILT